MCRRSELRGCLLLGLGLGLLVGQCLESWFLCTCGGSAMVFVGFLWLRRK